MREYYCHSRTTSAPLVRLLAAGAPCRRDISGLAYRRPDIDQCKPVKTARSTCSRTRSAPTAGLPAVGAQACANIIAMQLADNTPPGPVTRCRSALQARCVAVINNRACKALLHVIWIKRGRHPFTGNGANRPCHHRLRGGIHPRSCAALPASTAWRDPLRG